MRYIIFFILCPIFLSAQLPDSLLSIIAYQGLPANTSVRDIVVTKSNAKYIATNKGVFRIINRSSAPELLLEGDFAAICTNKKEDVWAMRGNTLTSLTEEITTLDGDIKVNHLLYNRGNIWISTNNGVQKINIKTKKKTANYSTRNSKMKSDEVNFVFADGQNQIWIGTNAGLCRINKKNDWKVFEKKLSMESMTYNKEGLWLVTNKEMWVIDDFGRWYPAALDKGLKDGKVRDITTDRDGRLVLASNALVRYNPYIDEIHSYSAQLGFLSKQTNALEGDLNQDIWIGTESDGLYLLSFGDTKTLELSAIIIVDQKITCKGSNGGALSVRASGGNGPYKYKWNQDKLSGNRLRGLKEGTYAVTVTDKNNNKFDTELFLDNPYPLNLSFDEIKGISAAGKKDGKAIVSISGGVPPYTYLWDDKTTSKNNLALSAGQHGLTITDADNCEVPVTIDIPAEKFIPQLDLANIEVGQILKVNQLFFQADSSSITQDFEPVLNEIYVFLKSNPSVVIEIGGHTNNQPPKEVCYRLSNARAKSIAEFLYRRGIKSERIAYKGYGKDKPIASNASLAGRNKNQRVEIKILSI